MTTQDKSLKFWSLHFNLFEMLKKGSISLDSLDGEKLEAAIYFNNWIETNP